MRKRVDLGKKMEGSGNYHLSTKQVAKKFEFQTKSPIGCSCICSSAVAFRERQKRRGKGIPTEDLWFIVVYPGRHVAVLCAHECVTSITWPFSPLPSLLSSNFSWKMENPNELPFAFLTQDWDIGNRFASTRSATLCCSHRVSALRDRNRTRSWRWKRFNYGNQGMLTFNSDLWALISHQTWSYLTS